MQEAAATGGSVPAQNAGIGTGKVLGSAYTDTLGAELGYGIDGKKTITLMGKEFIFAPVGMDDHDEASADLELLPTELLAFGMVLPGSKIEEITPQAFAAMLRVLTNNDQTTELSAAINVSLLFFSLKKEQRAAAIRLIWYCLRRWEPALSYEEVYTRMSFALLPFLIRLFFHKNLGVLDRFLHRLTELMPHIDETSKNDFLPTETIDPEEFRRLMSGPEGLRVGEEQQDAIPTPEAVPATLPDIPEQATPAEAAQMIVSAAVEATKQSEPGSES